MGRVLVTESGLCFERIAVPANGYQRLGSVRVSSISLKIRTVRLFARNAPVRIGVSGVQDGIDGLLIDLHGR